MTRDEWFMLPETFRQRWWRETTFDRDPPSDELKTEAQRLIEQAKERANRR